MSNIKTETVADIVREMRNANFQPSMYQVWVNEYADRIEAAHNREVVVSKNATTTQESLAVGNMAKMREVLEWLQVRLVAAVYDGTIDANEALKKVEAALAAPPRNCDKGLPLKDAMLAHLAEVYEGEKVEFGDYEWCEFVKWFIAEAKEGGAE